MATRRDKAAVDGTYSGSEASGIEKSYCPMERRETQRRRLITYLVEHGSISTIEARRALDIMSPASRVMELRRQGHAIVRRYDAQHGCGRYHLLPDQGGGDASDR